MDSTEHRYPRLRAVEMRPAVQDGRRGVLLRDPLQLSDKTLIVPQPLHLVLSLCDGTREDARALSASLAVRHGVRIAPSLIARLLDALDGAMLLDNASSTQARVRALAGYREAPYRPPAGAGQSYPADADDLKRLLDGYLDAARDVSPPPAGVRGLVSPHIDYARGGPVYARAWQRAAGAARAADLVVILGTDHLNEGGGLALTRQHYATPLGVLPTAGDVVDALAAALGEEAAFGNELYHRSEHSIELAAVWLHHVRQGEPCDLVPILCGSFRRFVQGGVDAAGDPALASLLEAFKGATGGRRVFVVAAGDLAHVGPAFGGYSLDLVGRARLKAADDALIARMCAGDAAGFLAEIRSVDDRNNVCGVPPIYLALRMLHPVRGELVAYDRCPAGRQGSSLVSVCGVTFT
jgi:AmmeMemoRadiSam system protein B